MPTPHFREAKDSMNGIQKIGISKELWDILHPEKLIKEEEAEEKEVPDSMTGIQKIGMSKELWDVLKPGTLRPLRIHQDL